MCSFIKKATSIAGFLWTKLNFEGTIPHCSTNCKWNSHLALVCPGSSGVWINHIGEPILETRCGRNITYSVQCSSMFDLWRLLLTLPWRCEEPPDQVQSPNTPATMTPDKVSQCIWPLELLQTQATHHRTLCGQLIQNNNKWFMDQIYQTDQHKNSKTVWKTLTNSLKPSSEKTVHSKSCGFQIQLKIALYVGLRHCTAAGCNVKFPITAHNVCCLKSATHHANTESGNCTMQEKITGVNRVFCKWPRPATS